MEPIVITMGDPSGISAEIILKTWLDREKEMLHPFFIVDCEKRIKRIIKFLDLDINTKVINAPFESKSIFKNHLPIFKLKQEVSSELGKPCSDNAEQILESLNISINLVYEKKASALVTSPLSKEILLKSGFNYLGQTEFIARTLEKKTNKKFEEIMILSTTKPDDQGSNLKVGLVTTHIPIGKIKENLSKKKIIEKIHSFHSSLENLWGINNPKIGVCGINPHCGENGLIGSEEKRIILPILNSLQKKYRIYGPLSADTCFSKYKRKVYDGIIAIYHDQGLIPIKTIDFFNSVNITGGIPIVRTSPDHGPAFDIAKSNKASNKSFIAAIKLATKISKENG